jgi:hypothetical protein
VETGGGRAGLGLRVIYSRISADLRFLPSPSVHYLSLVVNALLNIFSVFCTMCSWFLLIDPQTIIYKRIPQSIIL